MEKGIYTFIDKDTYGTLEEILNNPVTDYSLDDLKYIYVNYIDSVRYRDGFIYIEQTNDNGYYRTFLNHYNRREYDRGAYVGYPEYYSIRVTPIEFLHALEEIKGS